MSRLGVLLFVTISAGAASQAHAAQFFCQIQDQARRIHFITRPHEVTYEQVAGWKKKIDDSNISSNYAANCISLEANPNEYYAASHGALYGRVNIIEIDPPPASNVEGSSHAKRQGGAQQ